MAAKGPKDRRGRGKATEPETGPAGEPEASLPPQHATTGETESDGGADRQPPQQASGEDAESASAAEPMEDSKAAPEWGVLHLIAAGLAVVAAMLAGALLFGAAGDSGGLDRQAQRLDTVATQAEAQADRLGATEDAIADLRSEVGEVTAVVSELQAADAANRRTLDQIAQDLDALRRASSGGVSGGGEAVAELRDAVATLDQRIAGLEQGSNLDDFTGRIARLEEEIAALRQQTAEGIAQAEQATALGRAYAALTERLAAGAPFAEELEAVTAELPGAPGLEALRPHGGEGVATLADLRARLAEIAAEQAGEQPTGEAQAAATEDGVWQTMRERLEGMVKVRRADEADWPAIFGRADEALQRDDIDAAIAEVEQIGSAAPKIEAWLADARARRDAQAGLDTLSDAVLRQFAGRQ